MSRGTGIITNLEEATAWQIAVHTALGDPAQRTALLCLPWMREFPPLAGGYGASFIGHRDGRGVFEIHGFAQEAIPITFDTKGMNVEDGELADFGIEKLDHGTWAFSPSMNVPGLIHGFVVIHGVPHPAPWESLIVVVPG